MAEKKIINAETGEEVVKTAKKKVAEAEEAKPAKEKKIIKADGAEEAVKPAEKKKPAKAEAAEKPAKEKEVKSAGDPKDKSAALKYRVGAAVLWVAAIVFEVLAVLVLFGKIAITAIPTIALIIIALVLDLACVSVGSTLWKKANHIDPASKANKVKFWLWNNMGLIVTAFAFIPFIVLTLTNKNADKKTKAIATVVAVIALLIGGLISYDWNPVSIEDKEEAVEVLGDSTVYWSQFGKVYHTSTECSHLNNSDTLYEGSVEKAIEEGRVRICKDCAKRDNIETDEDGYVINKGTDSDAEFEDLELPEITDENNEAA